MSIMQTQLNKFITNPSKFRIEFLGEELAYRQTYNPIRYYFDSADYFMEKHISELAEEENLRQQQEIQRQILAAIQEQSITMQQKYGEQDRQKVLVEKVTNKHQVYVNYTQNTKKRVFDSADYFMDVQQSKNRLDKQHLNFEDLIEQSIKVQEDTLENRYFCIEHKKRLPLVAKQKKQFDSADYFLDQYKKTKDTTLQQKD